MIPPTQLPLTPGAQPYLLAWARLISHVIVTLQHRRRLAETLRFKIISESGIISTIQYES
jgi:hypothetical protein